MVTERGQSGGGSDLTDHWTETVLGQIYHEIKVTLEEGDGQRSERDWVFKVDCGVARVGEPDEGLERRNSPSESSKVSGAGGIVRADQGHIHGIAWVLEAERKRQN